MVLQAGGGSFWDLIPLHCFSNSQGGQNKKPPTPFSDTPTKHTKENTYMTETVYEHCSGDKTFTVTAAERWSIAMCKKLKEKYPDEVDIDYVNKDGSMVVHFPASWMKIKPKRTQNLSEEQRAATYERLRKGQELKAMQGENRLISEETD